MSKATFAAVGVLAVLALGFIPLVAFGPVADSEFSDQAPLQPTEPPGARNGCEREFASLTDGLGIAATPIPTPPLVDLLRVMNACTAAELIAADRRFTYVVGGPMTALLFREFFNGPDPGGQLRTLCASRAELSETKACTHKGAAE